MGSFLSTMHRCMIGACSTNSITVNKFRAVSSVQKCGSIMCLLVYRLSSAAKALHGDQSNVFTKPSRIS